jgi:hypothetical protein
MTAEILEIRLNGQYWGVASAMGVLAERLTGII